MKRPPARITLAIFVVIGSALMIASAVGTLWAWTTPGTAFGYKAMFSFLTASLFVLLFRLGVSLLRRDPE